MSQFEDWLKVVDELPSGYNTTDLPDADIQRFVEDESGDVMVRLGSTYCTFNDYNHATYPAPVRVREIVRNGALARCYSRLAMGDRSTALGSLEEKYRTLCERAKRELVGHDIDAGTSGSTAGVDIEPAIPAEVVTSQTITWGTGASQWDLETNEAFIPVEDYLDSGDIPTVMVHSVQVLTSPYTQYVVGQIDDQNVDACVFFDGRHQKWVIRDRSGYLSGAGATASIRYRWEYRRATWRPVPYQEDREVVFGGMV